MSLQLIKKFLPELILNKIQNYTQLKKLKFERITESRSAEFVKRRDFYTNFLTKGNLYFDIGANYGNRIAPMLSLNLKNIIAVEPQRKCCDVLRKKYKGITVLQMGVGAKEDVKKFFLSDDPVLSSFSPEFIDKTKDTRFKGHTWEDSEPVKITTLDRLIALYGSPDFIKIDVEGYELEVIRGLNQKVKYLSFEYTVPELEGNLEPICRKLHSLGPCKFNYSSGESMELNMPQWKCFDEIVSILKSKEFLCTGFGDLYVKYTQD